MKEQPIYQFKIKSKRTGKPINHYINNEDYGFYDTGYVKFTDERMKDIALGIVMALMQDKHIFVEIWKLNEQGYYDLIYTRF